MGFEIWALFAVTELLLCLTPGPAVLLVVSQGMRLGARASVAGNAGVLSGSALYFVLSALGLGGLLLASATLFQVVKWAGAAYLVYLGVRMVLSTFGRVREEDGQPEPAEPDRGRLFSQGFLTQVTNPKALVFFTALVPQFVSPGGDLVLQFAILGVTSVAVEFVVLLAYGWTAERGARLLGARAATLFERAGGTLLVVMGVGLAAADRR